MPPRTSNRRENENTAPAVPQQPFATTGAIPLVTGVMAMSGSGAFSDATNRVTVVGGALNATSACAPAASTVEVPIPPTPTTYDPSPAVGMIPAQMGAAAPYDASPLRRFGREPEHVVMYIDEIVTFLMERELTSPRDNAYLSNQAEVTERMRTILVDWLVDVGIKFKTHSETFHLAVDIVDRYLMARQVNRATLQLVGITAVLIAAKHEEIWPPEVRECVYITANSYTREDILRMERDVSDVLMFKFAVPTAFQFVTYFLQSTGATPAATHLAHYYLDYSALCYGMLSFRYSRVAAACVLLGLATEHMAECERQGLPRPDTETTLAVVWTEHHMRATRYMDVGEILACARALLQFSRVTSQEPRYRAVARKYAHAMYGEVSTRFPFPETI